MSIDRQCQRKNQFKQDSLAIKITIDDVPFYRNNEYRFCTLLEYLQCLEYARSLKSVKIIIRTWVVGFSIYLTEDVKIDNKNRIKTYYVFSVILTHTKHQLFTNKIPIFQVQG